ncbi:medium-chain acyl-[acyl-carrier-protein] hydrolase [Streptosporangium becharense]|uniref:Medium-chain acyl-[acyl-carrier-protein] hydrolase n=1 Tax=Streptosporangium becharense TaxID=1816182 RepID=A0A7W9MJX0_9ACTN|nr:alpha/beta fold hydrolase [Streptosporangium becharense]MBB2910393.1 medium-chain acyl-[acyl-carrier-protein] hydrolase [Streptosporangium becharense]MBB5823136.1 medium-chain acyl-[acyl-carrier-protein] hydrolase [Streptosporangium becharense]
MSAPARRGFTAESPWIRRAARDAPAIRLFCFPYAGAGASLFHGWPELMDESVEVVAVQLPGREDRTREPLPASMEELVSACGLSLLPYVSEPFALYGHCAGALLAYEVACELRDVYGVEPAVLLVAAHAAPCLGPVADPLHALPEERFAEELGRLGGIPEAVLANPGFMRALLPTLRADFTLFESHRSPDRPPLSCPIAVLRGDRDTVVGDAGYAAWNRHTTGRCEQVVVPGGHYFVNEFDRDVAGRVAAALTFRNVPTQEAGDGSGNRE